MLARSAQGLYWMSRYLERTQHLCRLLMLQTEALVDRPIREIHFGWSRIYSSVNRQPPSGGIELIDNDDYTLADSYALADDLTFERTNSGSVWSCFAYGRENARQMRQCISSEMGSCLNLAYLGAQNLEIQDIWVASPERFYLNMASEIDTFSGVAADTMYRDEGWQFMQLGQVFERAQLLCALLLTQIEIDNASEEYSDGDWTSLLRMYHALEAYNRRYGVEVRPEQALDLLATDILLPGSLIRSLDMAQAEISGIGPGPDALSSDATQQLLERLTSLVRCDWPRCEWPDQEDHRAILQQVDAHCRELHQLVSDSYFDYSSDGVRRG